MRKAPDPGDPPGNDRAAMRNFQSQGVICSLLLHLIVVILLSHAAWPNARRPPVRLAIPIDLVIWADDTFLPAASIQAPRPQLAAQETALQPRLPAAPRPQPDRPAPDPAREKLQQTASLHQPDSARPAEPQPQDGAGASNVTASPIEGAAGHDARYSIKDYLREQIERRWVPPVNSLMRNDWRVQLRLSLGDGGKLTQIEIIDDPRLLAERDFRDFAFSLRNAARLALPLSLPAGLSDAPREVILDFNPRAVQQ